MKIFLIDKGCFQSNRLVLICLELLLLSIQRHVSNFFQFNFLSLFLRMFKAFCFNILIILCSCQRKIGVDLSISSYLNDALKGIDGIAYGNAKSVNVISTRKSSIFNNFLGHFTVPIILETIEDLKVGKSRRDSTILIVSSTSEYDVFKSMFSSSLFDYRGQYLIVLSNVSSAKLENIFVWFWENKILNVNIMIEDQNESVNVYTFNPFNTTKCGSTTPLLISQYKNGNFSSDSGQFFPDKTSDL